MRAIAKIKRSSLLAAIGLALSPMVALAEKTPAANGLYWGDADSGEFNGKPFRLYGVDAPETGQIGSRGGAKCLKERKLGYIAKKKMREITSGSEISISRSYGFDPKGRELVDISVNGEDISTKGQNLGILAAWPHNVSEQLAPKPDWCR